MKSLFENFDLSAIKAQAPFLLLSALLSAFLVLGVLQLSGAFRAGGGSMTVAVFDVVKFANAQRAMASTFIGRTDNATDAGALLLSLSKKTTATIEKIAGPGTLVLVKQGIVSGSQVDITDAVLTELGLPTDVPTVGPMTFLEEVAPTMLMLPNRQAAPSAARVDAGTSNNKVLP